MTTTETTSHRQRHRSATARSQPGRRCPPQCSPTVTDSMSVTHSPSSPRNSVFASPRSTAHVESYQDLIRSLSLRGRTLLAESMASAAIGVAGDDAVAAVGHAWRRVAQERPGLYAATDRHPCTNDPELEAAVERIVEVIAMSLASFDLDPENRVHRGTNSAVRISRVLAHRDVRRASTSDPTLTTRSTTCSSCSVPEFATSNATPDAPFSCRPAFG